MIPLLPRNAITPCTAGNSMKTISRVSSTVTNEQYTISSISTMTPTVTPITLRALLLAELELIGGRANGAGDICPDSVGRHHS